MTTDYFKDFKGIKLAKNAKSLSYFSENKNANLSQNLLNHMIYILRNKEDRFRISLHTSSDDDLHNMIIAIKKNNFVYPHKHSKSESYHILKGSVLLIYFNDNGKVINCIELNSDNYLIARVDKHQYHALISLEDSIYHETRIGPFIAKEDSIFAKWIGESPDNYMNNLLMELKC